MRRVLFVLTVVTLARQASGIAQDDIPDAEREAVTALKELGGQFKTEGGHVVSASLLGDKVTDAALEHLKSLQHLRALSLGAKVTDADLPHLTGRENRLSTPLAS